MSLMSDQGLKMVRAALVFGFFWHGGYAGSG